MRRHFNVISTATTQFSGTPDPLTLAPTPSDYVEHHQVQTGSSNNLATDLVTDIDAISVAIPMFGGKVFTGVYVNFARNFLPSEIPRWPTYTGSSYNFATENDTKGCGNVSGHVRSTSTSINIVQLETTLSGANWM